MIRALPLHDTLAVDVIEDQADHQLRHRPTRLGGQRLPLRRLYRLDVVRLREQASLDGPDGATSPPS